MPGAVAVCFDAPVVELFEQRAEGLHPGLATLGPDLLDPGFDEAMAAEALRRLPREFHATEVRALDLGDRGGAACLLAR